MGLSRDEYRTVLSYFKKAQQQEPEVSYLRDIGFCQAKLDQWEEAAASFEEALRNQRDDAALYRNLGHSYIKLKRFQEAVRALKRSLELRPNSPNTLYKLAAAYYGMGRLRQAREPLFAIIKQDPAHIKANFGLGLISHYLGEREECARKARFLQDLDPALAEKLLTLHRQAP